jgi:hypothetical protein
MNMPNHPVWGKSRFCDTSSCVEVSNVADAGVAIRNSNEPERVIHFSRPEWAAFIAGVRAGDFLLDESD